jgi:ammonia channel protein AmtB
MSSVYESCLAELSDGAEPNEMLFCVARQFEEQEQARNTDLKDFLFVLAGALIFFMQTGFAMLCAGSVRIKNVQNTMLKNLLDASGAALAFWLVGYAFAFGGQDTQEGTTFIGYEGFFKLGSSPALWFFQYTFSATAVTIVAGTLAERCQMAAYLCYSVFLTGFVYPIVAHSIWSNNGFLSGANADPFLGIGVLDFAGSGVVHVTGGKLILMTGCFIVHFDVLCRRSFVSNVQIFSPFTHFNPLAYCYLYISFQLHV